mgnify:CR=1 FL=1
MKEIILGNHIRKVPSVAVGCMRLSEKSKDEMNRFIHAALEQGAYLFDHADIYGDGMSESIFGEAFADDSSIKREDIYLQSKCGIRQGFYDLSKEHILKSVDGILQRLHTDYLDLLLLHRPDALVEPEDVAAAFDVLYESGKVRHFGVSNHKPMQIELLQKYVRQPLVVDQVQFSIPVSNLVANGMEVNMETLDFIVSQLDPDKVTFKVPVFDDDDLAFAKMIQERYQPDVMFLSAGNPEPKAEGNIVQHQLGRLKELWETVAADDSWGNVRVLPQLHTLLYDNERGV